MSTQHLEDRGSFVPEGVRGKEPRASLSATVTVAFGVFSVAACVLMVIGGGAGLTWAGAGAFLLLLWLFTFLADRGIDRQSQRVEDWLEEAGEEDQLRGEGEEDEEKDEEDEEPDEEEEDES